MSEIKELKLRLELAKVTLKGIEHKMEDLGGVDFAPFALFRHIWRMADGILILAEKDASYPMFALLRSMFEAYLSLKYILQDSSDPDLDFSKKSRGWQAWVICKIVKEKELIEPDTNQGIDFVNCLKKLHDPIASDAIEKIRDETGNNHKSQDFRDLLNKPHLVEFCSKLDSEKPPYFFNLFRAKIGIEGLSKLTGDADWILYKLYYGQWSGAAHGTDIYRLLGETAEDDSAFGPLRGPHDTAQALSSTKLIFVLSEGLFFNHYQKEFKAFKKDLADQDRYWELVEELSSFAKLEHDAE
jgi:hypothetical protein